MLRPLIEIAGVDYAQWRALSRFALKLDFRQRTFGRTPTQNESSSQRNLILIQVLMYSIVGALMSTGVWAITDLFMVGFVLSAYVMFVVGTAVLVDHGSTLTSTLDYAVLGFRPVTSRTYFAVRLTNILIYTVFLTTALAYLPIATLFVRRGVMAGLAGVATVYGASFFATFLLLLGYAWMLRVVSAHALKNVLSILQLVMGFGVYGGYFVAMRFLSQEAIRSMSLSKTWWLLMMPPAWFASYLDLARGRFGTVDWVPALVSIAALGGMMALFFGRLSSEFGNRLSDISVASGRPAASPSRRASRRTWWFHSGEGRAMSLLIRSQFRNDQKFRMGVLAILPLTILYVFMGMEDGPIPDPFVRGAGRGGFSLVNFAVMLFPTMLKAQLGQSDSFRASWLFFSAPASRARLVRASKDVVATTFLLPYLAVLGALFFYMWGNVWHVLLHVTVLGLLSHLVLQAAVFIDPALPFSQPAQKGGNTAKIFGLMFCIGLVNFALAVLTRTIYRSPIMLSALIAGIIVVSVFVELLTKARVEEQTRKLEFLG